jgi:hypothetical protein
MVRRIWSALATTASGWLPPSSVHHQIPFISLHALDNEQKQLIRTNQLKVQTFSWFLYPDYVYSFRPSRIE